MFRSLAISLLVALLWWAPCPAQAPAKPRVISSFTVIQDWVQTVGGEGVEVLNLVPSRSEAHGYQLNPRNAQDLRRADLIVAMSPDLEPWLAAWCEANGKADQVLWLHPKETGRGHSHGGHANPHAWTDPIEVSKMIATLAQQLEKVRTGFDFQTPANQYLIEVKRVDAELAALFAPIPPAQRLFLAQHANLDLLAARYGLTVAGTILPHGSAESADPSARHISNLLTLIREKGVRVIVTDEGQNDTLARRLTEDAGLPPPLRLSFESLSPSGQPGDTWSGMMLTNGRRLQQALLQR